ncbi:hypothetical protein KQX54_003508 [Cotesia glomerata]|uniref:FZ domain-containing protein n=2 Tax=Cotesia glomerata TaxID=32391 RepID=A0AAV7HSP4_COTGL|nr:hypothetical protein KQX54_003508 [Cotesia glomerata]
MAALALMIVEKLGSLAWKFGGHFRCQKCCCLMLFLQYLLIFCLTSIASSSYLDSQNFYNHEKECIKKTVCNPIDSTDNFCGTLPYSMTTSDLLPDNEKSFKMKSKRFRELQAAKYFPVCWEALQPLVCALYNPKCVNGSFRVPGFKMCMKAVIACEPIREHPIWPEFIDCNNKTLFPRSCEEPISKTEFNNTSQCMEPLLASENQSALGIAGCGLPCYDPFYSREEHQTTDQVVFIGAWTCMFFNLVAVFTLVINGPLDPPAFSAFCTSSFFVIFCLGWLLQFTPFTSREDIACHKDGTRRIHEPIDSNIISSVVCGMIYYSMMAILLQWVTFAETYYRIVCQKPEKSSFKWLNFFFVAVIYSVIIYGNLDGSGLTGIAFKGLDYDRTNMWLSVMTFVVGFVSWGLYYFRRAINRMKELFKKNDDSILPTLNFRTFVFVELLTAHFCFILIYTTYELFNGISQEKSLKNYIMCKIFNTIGENNECLLEQSELAGKWFQILSMFSMGVVATMLVWTKSAVQSWKNLFSSFFGKEIKEENKLVLFIDFDALDAEVQRLEMKEKSDDPEKQQLETKN